MSLEDQLAANTAALTEHTAVMKEFILVSRSRTDGAAAVSTPSAEATRKPGRPPKDKTEGDPAGTRYFVHKGERKLWKLLPGEAESKVDGQEEVSKDFFYDVYTKEFAKPAATAPASAPAASPSPSPAPAPAAGGLFEATHKAALEVTKLEGGKDKLRALFAKHDLGSKGLPALKEKPVEVQQAVHDEIQAILKPAAEPAAAEGDGLGL